MERWNLGSSSVAVSSRYDLRRLRTLARRWIRGQLIGLWPNPALSSLWLVLKAGSRRRVRRTAVLEHHRVLRRLSCAFRLARCSSQTRALDVESGCGNEEVSRACALYPLRWAGRCHGLTKRFSFSDLKIELQQLGDEVVVWVEPIGGEHSGVERVVCSAKSVNARIAQ